MITEDALSEGDFTGFNVRNKDTIHEMVSMSEKNGPPPTSKVKSVRKMWKSGAMQIKRF
jgi:hypothetical protein